MLNPKSTMPEILSNKLLTTICFVLLTTWQATGFSNTVSINQYMEVPVGESKIVRFEKEPTRMALSNPGIVHILQITPTEWEVIGRNPGRTNLYVWIDQNIIGSEIAVGLPTPPYLRNSRNMELVNGGNSELIYLGHPSERIKNSLPGKTNGLVTDMPEPCLLPGCI